MNTADDLIYRWTTQKEAEDIARQTRDRRLVADYVVYARDREDAARRRLRNRARDAFAAIFVSALGVAMLLALIFGWSHQ
jgi:hypothetical protein